MIISASRRTDIPAAYGDWYVGRLRAGYVLVRNPINPNYVARISLRPEDVECVVYWTKNPVPFFDRLTESEELGYRNYYFQFTLNPYDDRYEKNLPDKAKLIDAFKKLADRVGPERVLWRYDPIITNYELTPDWHYERFRAFLRQLKGYTDRCTVSFLDDYDRMHFNSRAIILNPLDILNDAHAALMKRMAAELVKIRDEEAPKVALYSCAEPVLADVAEISRSKCIDDKLVERISGAKLDPAQTESPNYQRTGCGCARAYDIGANNTCPNGCIYCYATSIAKAKQNAKEYDPAGEMLCSKLTGEERIHDKGESWALKAQQTSLFDL